MFKSTDAAGSWSPLPSPRPAPPFAFVVAIDPQTPSTLYVGTNGDDLFKSTNGGSSWTSSGPISTQAIAIDPQTPSTIFAGTDVQLFKSVNAGASFVSVLSGTTIFAVAIDPHASNIVYAGARGFLAGRNGVLKSTDGGGTWVEMNSGLPAGRFIRAIVIDPQVSSTLYAAPGPAGEGVFVSTDAAATWTPMNEGLLPVNVRALAVDPGASVIYAGTEGDGVAVRTLRAPTGTLSVRLSGRSGRSEREGVSSSRSRLGSGKRGTAGGVRASSARLSSKPRSAVC
jgi:photosystem II stability/assembly factor-like uncharacterized protein